MQETEAILSLGSNLGDRLANLLAAHEALAGLPRTRITARAPIYETEPVDVPEQHRHRSYLNTIIIVATGLGPDEFSDAMHTIEARLGRRRVTGHNAPRIIDIDLIAFGDTTRQGADLRLPHPEAMRRRFVCQPLADVRPGLRLPGFALTVGEQLAKLPPSPTVVYAKEQWQ